MLLEFLILPNPFLKLFHLVHIAGLAGRPKSKNSSRNKPNKVFKFKTKEYNLQNLEF